MPADNVNTAALALVVDAAQRFKAISEALDLSPLDDDDGTLGTAILMMEESLEKALPYTSCPPLADTIARTADQKLWFAGVADGVMYAEVRDEETEVRDEE
jgi:hypothetical protein|tara:strand:- start:290 stop:592 length:303 start_codon:yes stop_codon:yes gene_type:complete